MGTSNVNDLACDTVTSTGLGSVGSLAIGGTTLTASAAELNRVATTSARLIAGGSALTLTQAAHDGKVILLDTAAGTTITLPAASGSGMRFSFIVKTTATSNSHKIQVANASDIMQGLLFGLSDDGAGGPVKGWEAGATDDTITFNRTTTGTAKVGHRVTIEDIAANVWTVSGSFAASGTEATPFSSAV